RANLSWEAQLASTRHVITTAAPRAARQTGSDRRIPIAPRLPFHSAACSISSRLQQQRRCDPPPHRIVTITQRERGGNGDSCCVVNQWLRVFPLKYGLCRPASGQCVAAKPHCAPISLAVFESF